MTCETHGLPPSLEEEKESDRWALCWALCMLFFLFLSAFVSWAWGRV